MTADDALKIADDMENRSERSRSTLNNRALVALAAEVRLLRADGYRRGMEDMRERCAELSEGLYHHAYNGRDIARDIREINIKGEL